MGLLLALLLSHIRVCLAIRSNVDDICGQQRAYGLKKLLRFAQRYGGLGVTHMGSAAIISNTPQVR
jgi:hypothetical protein